MNYFLLNIFGFQILVYEVIDFMLKSLGRLYIRFLYTGYGIQTPCASPRRGHSLWSLSSPC